MEGIPKVMLAFVHPGTYTVAMGMSVLRYALWLKHRVTVAPSFSGANVSTARNESVEALLASDDEYLLFVDTDIEFMPEDVQALIDCDVPIVGGNYVNRFDINGEPLPVASVHLGDGEYGRATPANVGTDHGMVEVSGCGMGFTLIRRAVLEDLQFGPLWPFAEIAVPGDQVGAESEAAKKIIHLISEDICFCYRARHRGFLSYVNLDVRVRHHKMTSYLPPDRQLVDVEEGIGWNV